MATVGCATAPLAGCASKGDLAVVQTRISRLEKSRVTVLTRLRRDQHRLKRLLDEIEESTGFLRESGADLTARIDRIEDNLRKTGGDLEVVRHRMAVTARYSRSHRDEIDNLRGRLGRLIADLRDRAGIAILALPRDLPEKAEDWVVLARNHFDYGEVRVAEAVSKECGKRFAGTPTAGSCTSIQAQIAYEEHRFADALKLLQSIHDGLNARAVPVVGKALLQISVVLEAQGKCRQARDVLKYLRAEMPKLAHAKAAKARMATMRKVCTQGVQTLPTKTSGTKKRDAAKLPDGATPDGG
jgi:hypothetical protein